MELEILVCIVIGILAYAAGYLGCLIFRKTNGDIVYEVYLDENKEEAVRCTFKLDLDVDDIVKENAIMLNVVKDQKVLDFYKKT